MKHINALKSALVASLFLLVLLVVGIAQADPHFQDDFNGATLGAGLVDTRRVSRRVAWRYGQSRCVPDDGDTAVDFGPGGC